MINSGELRNLITIEQLTVTKDAFGAPVETWTTFATVWAKIEALSGSELIAARQLYTSEIYTVQIRYLAGVTQKHRINYQGQYWDIVQVNDFEFRHYALDMQIVHRVTS